MKQAFYNKEGVVPHDVPVPPCGRGLVKVDIAFSCISAGTEMAAVKNSKKSLIKRVMADRKKYIPKAIELLRGRGIRAAMKVVEGSVNRSFGTPLGYTAAGVVSEVGSGVSRFSVGQRVAVLGAGFANHAAVDCVPENLVAAVPDGVSLEEASTAAVGCIAMQGVRRLEPVFGEKIVVMGLGIMGILAVQMLRSMGCYVIGIDLSPKRMQAALELGCNVVLQGDSLLIVQDVMLRTGGFGADGVLFTAATHSNVPMANCFKMLRRKGRFILLGVSGMEIDRSDIYAKELDLKIATSYGAGRYDDEYETGGKDYPRAYVRWTENRNLQAYLAMIAEKKLNVGKLINAVYNISDVNDAYRALNEKDPPLILLLSYGDTDRETRICWENKNNRKARSNSAVSYAIIGAGSFARSMHLPNLSAMPDKFYLKAIMSRTGSAAAQLAELYGAEYSTTCYDEILNDPDIEMVMICTRHNVHADLSIRALRAGKAVFVEKPAAITFEQMRELEKAIEETKRPYMVGFNRRFSDFAVKMRKVLADRKTPLNVMYTMNAGYLPKNHWTHNLAFGGGRMVGEGCHILDMIGSVVGSEIERLSVNALRDDSGYYYADDNTTVNIVYKDGSIATMIYNANGSPSYPKETMRVYYGDACIVMSDYKTLKVTGGSMRAKHIKLSASDKGHKNELACLYKGIRSDKSPIALQLIVETTMATLALRNRALDAASRTN